jgi:hypothetical protein
VGRQSRLGLRLHRWSWGLGTMTVSRRSTVALTAHCNSDRLVGITSKRSLLRTEMSSLTHRAHFVKSSGSRTRRLPEGLTTNSAHGKTGRHAISLRSGQFSIRTFECQPRCRYSTSLSLGQQQYCSCARFGMRVWEATTRPPNPAKPPRGHQFEVQHASRYSAHTTRFCDSAHRIILAVRNTVAHRWMDAYLSTCSRILGPIWSPNCPTIRLTPYH